MVSFFSPISFIAIWTSERRVDLSGLILKPLLLVPEANYFLPSLTLSPEISFLFFKIASASSAIICGFLNAETRVPYIPFLVFRGGDPSERQTDSSSSEINSIISLLRAVSLEFPILVAIALWLYC